MTRPTARVLALLEILQGGGTRTAAELARRLGVDERTVRRYVAHLVDLDVPVESVRGRYGGIHLVPGYRMPPLMLTDDEAFAVLVGLLGTGGAGGAGPTGPTGAAGAAGPAGTAALARDTAAAKVMRMLPKALARRLDAVRTGVRFTADPQQEGAPERGAAPETEHLLVVAEAARDHRPVRLDYTDSQGRRTTRTVHPYGIVAHSGRWYVTAVDPSAAPAPAAGAGTATGGDAARADVAAGSDTTGPTGGPRGAVRTFRVDRIEAVTPLPGSFEVPAGFDPAGTLLSAVAEAPRRYVVTLRVRASAEQARGMFPPGLATVAAAGSDHDGWSRVVIRAERLEWVPAVLAGVGAQFVVEGPQELRALVRALADRLVAAAEG